MIYRKLGSSGLQVSTIGLGTNNFGSRIDKLAANRVVSQALDLGINLIDTSNSYGGTLSEEFIGSALKGRREEAVIATKVSSRMGEGPNQSGNSRKHIMYQVDKSLMRLETDYIDLYQIHWWDESTPLHETLMTLDDLVKQGKIRYFGCSNFSAWQVCEAIWTSRVIGINTFVSVQPHYSMLERSVEDELIPFCDNYRLGVLPYFPLANGFLTGKYRRGVPLPEGTRLHSDDRGLLSERNLDLIEDLTEFCSSRGKSILDLAFAWLLNNDSVSSVIAGAMNAEQVSLNAAAANWDLTTDEYRSVTLLLP